MSEKTITITHKELKKLINQAVKAQAKKDAAPKPFICLVPKYGYKPMQWVDIDKLLTPSNS